MGKVNPGNYMIKPDNSQFIKETNMRYKIKVKGIKFKVKKLGVAALLAFPFSLSTLTAQESINATGGNASGSGGLVSYSVGQVVYQAHTGTNGSVMPGVQQPFEIWVITGLEEATGISLSISVYPNPSKEHLALVVKDLNISNLFFQLYDMQEKLMQSKKIVDNQTTIDMSNLVPAIYFVTIIQGSKKVKTFKIIKN